MTAFAAMINRVKSATTKIASNVSVSMFFTVVSFECE